MAIRSILSLLAGVGMLLFGIKTMGDGLEYAAGSKMKKILGTLTKNRFTAVLMGALVTALIQSSAATTVMVVGFVNAGLMTLAQAAGVIMGANIGTTATSVLIALNLGSIAPVALFIGVFLYLFVKKDIVKHIGQTIAGSGMLFFGLNTMSSATEFLQSSDAFIGFITKYSNPFIGILIGIVITVAIQSSAGSIGILQALALQGLIPLNFAIYIIYGQNIGTVVTALISSAASKTNSKRAAVIHLLFNVVGTIIFLLITAFTPYVSLLESFTDNPAAQISAAHIIFNVVSTIIIFPFINKLIKLSCILVPEKEEEAEDKSQFKFYDTRLLSTPPVAVAQIGREVVRMAELARKNLNRAADALINADTSKCGKIIETEDTINFLNHNITSNLVKINALDLDYSDAKYIGRLFHVVNDIERIGDHALNLSEAAQVRVGERMEISDEALAELENMRRCTMTLLDGAISAFEKQELTAEEASRLGKLENTVDDLKREYETKHIERLNKNRCETRAGLMFVNTLIDFERVGDHAMNIAWKVRKRPQEEIEAEPAVIGNI
ncbi:MAG: Na/Pi cotransporter family protein [Oscillospiraceae bacterium]|nr:Na/Pi cotransporter family protein [Oscillospiraceae bacterium]